MNSDNILRIIRTAKEAGMEPAWHPMNPWSASQEALERFAELVAAAEREACIKILEAYQIPLGNSPSGELAADWTYDALKQIRDDIRARGGE